MLPERVLLLVSSDLLKQVSLDRDFVTIEALELEAVEEVVTALVEGFLGILQHRDGYLFAQQNG